MPGKRYAHIYTRDSNTCQYCGNRATTVDHLTPRRAGGGDDLLNLVGACKRCNKVKGHMELPNLVQSFRLLLSTGRTHKNGCAPLFWQALQLAFPVEDVPWSERRSLWALKQLGRALFQNPDQPREVIPKEEALALLAHMQACSLERARTLAQRLLTREYMVEEHNIYRTRLPNLPLSAEPRPIPDAPTPVHNGPLPLVGEPRNWYTSRQLLRHIRKELHGLPAKTDARHVYHAMRRSEDVYECEPYILLDRRTTLRALVKDSLRQLES